MSLTTTRPRFPAAKSVSFRAQLTEEIKTEKYTLAHSDLESSSSTISTLNLPSPAVDLSKQSSSEDSEKKARVTGDAGEGTVLAKKGESASPSTGDKRDSSDEDSDTCPVTPVAGRRKRRREWVWTLGPIENGDSASPEAKEGCEEEVRS